MTHWLDSSTNLVPVDSLVESVATPSTLSLPHSASLVLLLSSLSPLQPLVDCSICSSHNALLLQLHHDVINIFCTCCQLLANTHFPTHQYSLISLYHVSMSLYSLSFFTHNMLIVQPTLFSLSLHSYSICLI